MGKAKASSTCPICGKKCASSRGVQIHGRIHETGGSLKVKPRGGGVKVKPRGGNVIDRVKSAKRTYKAAKGTAANVSSIVKKGTRLAENTIRDAASFIKEVTALGPQLLSLGEQVKHTVGFGLNPFEGVTHGTQDLQQVSGSLCRICRRHDIALPEEAARQLHFAAKGGSLPITAAKFLLPAVLPFVLKKLAKPITNPIPGLGIGQIDADTRNNHVW